MNSPEAEELDMRGRWIVLAPLAILGMLFFIAVGGGIVLLLWNWLLPPLFGWPEIGFWQALGLLALCRILFGGFGVRGSTRSRVRRRVDRRIAERLTERLSERMRGMTPEERERLLERLRGRSGASAAGNEEQ